MSDDIIELTEKEIGYLENQRKKAIEYFENELKKENNKKDLELLDTICRYYIKEEPNIEKIIYYCNYMFENELEIQSDYGFEWYIRENKPTIESLEQYDYPFVHKYLGEEYFKRENINKTLEHFKKGAEQKSLYCALLLFSYYITGKLELEIYNNINEMAYIEYLSEKNEIFENDIIKLIFKSLKHPNNITKEEKDEINRIIMNSKGLLFYKSLIYYKAKNIDMFLYYCELSASKGCYKANALLAEKYLDEDFPKRNLEKSLYYINKMYEIKDNHARFLYEEIIEILIKEKKIEMLEDKRILNDYLLDRLGTIYFSGEGVEQDYKKALEYFEQSAQKGNIESLNRLGMMYYTGEGVEQDYKKALEYFEQSTQKGNIESLNRLGMMHYYGEGVEQDYIQAREYLKKVLRINPRNKEAKLMLLKIRYIQDELTEKDYIELFELSELSDGYRKDEYFKNIKNRIKNGSKIIVEKNIKNITLERLNKLPDDTIINLKNTLSSFEICKDFYTCKDMKKIIEVLNKIIKDIDLGKNEEDIFMQIYIKLGMIISYDDDLVKKDEEERTSISRNLMTLINKRGVCTGYATILKNTLDIIGIDSEYIVSKSYLKKNKRTRHVYNQVRINGIWYNCDLTFDSNMIKSKKKPEWCLKSKETFETIMAHQPVNEKAPIIHETNEDYKKIDLLFYKNNLKLFKNKIKNKFIEQIVTSPIIDEGGKRK